MIGFRKFRTSATVVVAILLCAPLAAGEPVAPQASSVHFRNSCTAEVQAQFDHAVTLLHSSEYPETTRLFA